MASLNARVTDLRGLIPAIDPRKQDDVRLLTGDNVIFTADGILSAYGDRLLTPTPFEVPEHTQGVRIRTRTGDRTFHFTDHAILEWDEVAGDYQYIYVFDDVPLIPYRWSFGFLNNILYFCHPSTGILFLDTRDDSRGRLNVPGIPEVPLSITVDNGRLAIIDENALFWSAQSDGFDFNFRLGGPGFQTINDRVSGRPVTCVSYARGILTLTSGGIMRSEFTGDAAVYRHRAINTEYAPINSLCVFKTVEDQVVFLDRRGFFATTGDRPQPFTPLWNEFLIEELKKYRLLERENLRVEWDENNRLLYLSMSLTDVTPFYDFAYVMYQPLDKWARFSEPHYAIMPVNIGGLTERRGQYFGYVDADGLYHYWNGFPSRERLPEEVTLNLIEKPISIPLTTPQDRTHTVMPCTVTSSVADPTQIEGTSGYFRHTNINPAAANLTGLAARVRMGVIRFPIREYPDETSELTDISVGSILSSDGRNPVEDFNTVPDGVNPVDYNTATGGEDYGFGRLTFVNFGLNVIGSIDSRTEFDAEPAVLSDFYAAERYYDVCVVGVYFILEFTATEVGEAFHLRTIEVSAIIDAGRAV